MCTFGFFTIGWLLDICRIPCLVLTQNNHAVIDDIDDTKYASSVEFVSTIYDKTVEMECIPERKVVQERTLDLDHFAIKNKTPVQQISPPKQYENSFFQPLESPIHRRSLSSSNLAGKLGPKRAPSVRTTKTQVQSLPPSPRKACDHDSSDDDDVIITKVITTPRGNGLPPISRNGGKPVLQTTAYDETIDDQTVNTPRYDDVERKDKNVTQQNEDKLLQNKVTHFCIDDSTMSNKMTNCRENSRSDDVVVKKIVITPRSNDTVTAKKVKSPRYNDVGITSIGGRPRSDDEDLTHRGRGPVWDGRGDDITETCEGLSPREVTQWMSWREDDIIL
ncbi:uncharacterized protein LOC110446526 [Mizuhopecten yessoensis]|nr:uncharacterized protein LOC110446526 [Mizuhopecten yessoensis]